MNEETKVIGTAKLDVEGFHKFLEEENQRYQNNEDTWNNVMLETNKKATNRFYDAICGPYSRSWNNKKGCRRFDSCDARLLKHNAFLESLGLKWELLYMDEYFAIIRSGNSKFGLPKGLMRDVCFYKELDEYSIDSLRLLKGGDSEISETAIVPDGSLSKKEMHSRIDLQKADIENKKKELEELKEEKRKEIERAKREVEERFKEQFALLEQKQTELNEQLEVMKTQLFVLDTEIYGIRCFMGETIQFSKILAGVPSSITEPVVLYQKIRFLDEEMGKYISLYDFDEDDIGTFEEVLKHREDIRDIFLPTEKCVALVKISRNEKQYGQHPRIANMLTEYETFHGSRIGILIRNGGNIYVGWTDIDRVDIKDGNAFFKPGTQEVGETREKDVKSSTKEEIASRYFVFNILQGIIHHGQILSLPEGSIGFKNNPYIIFSMADGWLEDNRFGTFADIINRTNAQPLQRGDHVLTMMRITRDDKYSGGIWGRNTSNDAWNNDRGRGDRNRTHNAHLKNMTIYPVNCVDTIKEYNILYRLYRCDVIETKKENDSDTDYPFFNETEVTFIKTDELVKEEEKISFTVENGYLHARTLEKFRARANTEELLEQYLELDKEYWQRLNTPKRDGYCEVYGIEAKYTEHHYFLSAAKDNYWSETDARANMEIYEGEYINLTYLNSVYIRYAIKNNKIGGIHVPGADLDYAQSLPYLNTALEYLLKREEKESEMLGKYMELYPDWQVDVSEWRLKHQYHSLTETRAKRFVKEYEKANKTTK